MDYRRSRAIYKRVDIVQILYAYYGITPTILFRNNNNVPDAIRFSSHLRRAAAVRLGDKYMLMATLYTLYILYYIWILYITYTRHI